MTAAAFVQISVPLYSHTQSAGEFGVLHNAMPNGCLNAPPLTYLDCSMLP